MIVPTLNPGKKIASTLESLRHQDEISIEALVVDGGSSDGTLELVGSMGVDLMQCSAPGVYPAMNLGLRSTSGKIVYFLGAGDRLRPGILEKVARAWPDSRRSLLYGDVWMEDLQAEYGGEFSKERLHRENVCHQAIFYSRELFLLHGEFEPRFPVLADYAFNLRVFGDARVKKVHLDLLIADYEGGGLSARTVDELFQAEKKSLCRESLA